jgi:Fe-S-cluster containining protein
MLLERGTAFSYECRSCRSCCVDKVIHVSPYDIARIANHRKLTTTQVIAEFTTDAGTSLAVRPDGSCVFLGENGCSIHSDRPMVCRLYPLGRTADEKGDELYLALEPHPSSQGVYATRATVADYLGEQGVEPFIAAADRYLAVLMRMRALVDRSPPRAIAGSGAGSLRAEGSRSLDMDPSILHYCGAHGLEMPERVEDKLELHIRALDEWLDGLEELSPVAET